MIKFNKNTIGQLSLFLGLWISLCSSCSKTSTPDLTPPDGGQGTFTFTSRGDKTTGEQDRNYADFHKTLKANYDREDFYMLDIQTERLFPHSTSYKVVIQMITTKKLKKGTYPIVKYDDVSSYYYGSIDPDAPTDVALAYVADTRDSNNDEKGINSISGSLVVTSITRGEYHPDTTGQGYDYIAGTISGHFEFDGNNANEDNPGHCEGKFDKIPLKIFDKP